MERYSFSNLEEFKKLLKEIPENGIYVLFEKGEFGHGVDRIVRVGTHTGKNQLRSRLFQHFVKENKDRSIFRKNIGRALLSKVGDPFLKKWELDLTPHDVRVEHGNSSYIKKQNEIEKRVTNCIQNNFSFVVFGVDDGEKRLALESKIISTVNQCDECKPSNNWLGLFAANQKYQSEKVFKNCLKIKESGLWLVNELGNDPISENELVDLRKCLVKINSIIKN